MSTTERAAQENNAVVVLAAGQGTRMRSARAKVLHELGGEPMIARVVRRLSSLGARVVVVVGYQAQEVEAAARSAGGGADIRVAVQREQRGTGHALIAGLSALDVDFAGGVIVTYGDVPMIDAATIAEFIRAIDRKSAVGFISAIADDPAAFGRVIRDSNNEVEAIVEARDATPAQLAIREVNTGVYFFPEVRTLREIIAKLRPDNNQSEYYLTDLVSIARRKKMRAQAWTAPAAGEFAGINTREELVSMEAEIRREVNRKLMDAGVTIVDPATAYISEHAQIARDCVIGPNVQIIGKCSIGEGTRIEGTAWLHNVSIGARCHIKLGVRAEDCTIGAECDIGPFANLRAGTELAGKNRIGNFVETKKAKIGVGTKASHLSYLGDTTIGHDTNIGCGVITVNYDGYEKHHTEIGDRCMVGCDTQLIAPIKVGSDVYVASGTTLVTEASDGALVRSHHPQREISGWMATWRARHGDKAQKSDDD